jgi:hypothetical protein
MVLFTFTLAAAPRGARTQEPLTEHTRKLAAGQTPPPATIQDMAWLAGHWTGEALGGLSEEIWSPPRDGVMLGMYRLIRDGKPAFYEILTLAETGGSLMLRLKHFNPDLTGWEEKDQTVDFPFLGKAGALLHFEGMAFQPEGQEAVTVFLAIEQKDGTFREEVFRYRRVPAGAASGPGR